MNEINDESESFIFTFNDKRKMVLSQNQLINISTTFYYKHINKENSNKIKIPNDITYENFLEFLEIFQKNSPILEEQVSQEKKIQVSENVDLVQLVKISEFLENDTFSLFLINEFFLCGGENKISKKYAYSLLILSYNKLNELNNNNYNNEEDIETIWLDLFMKSLDIVGKNLLYFFQEKKLDSFDKKIIDELLEKFSMNLISNNFLINCKNNNKGNTKEKISEKNENINNMNNINIQNSETINKEKIDKDIKEIKDESNSVKINNIDIEGEKIIDLKNLKKIIEFLVEKRSQSDFFCLLSNEFMKISCEENINEINNLPNPTFLLKLDVNDINTYYEEYPIDNQINNNEQIKIIFIIYYKKAEDSFNVSLKLTKTEKQNNGKTNTNSNNIITNNNIIYNFDILTFLSSVTIEELAVKQINIKSISNNKSMYEILKINNFSKLLSLNSNEYLTLKIFLKPCFTHSILCSYFFYNFDELYNNKNIFKIQKSLLNIIIRKKQVNNNDKNMDKIVVCLFNWLNDEINIREDISEIIENIDWKNISLPLLFEFIIKYAKNISKEELEHIFLNSLAGRSNNYNSIESFNQEIIKSLFISSKKTDYIFLFCENIKLNKFNSYEMINQERNNISQNDNSQNKYSLNKKNSKNSKDSKISEQSNIIKNLNNNKYNDKNNNSIVINNYSKKHNKSTTNLYNNLRISHKNINKNNISLNKNNDLIISPKPKIKKEKKKFIDNYSNKKNKSVDIKYINGKNKTNVNKKRHQRIYLESNNKKNIFNKSYFDNKIFKIINNRRIKENENKKSKNKISLITELNKLKLKIKTNPNANGDNQIQKIKKFKIKSNYNAILNKTENNFH